MLSERAMRVSGCCLAGREFLKDFVDDPIDPGRSQARFERQSRNHDSAGHRESSTNQAAQTSGLPAYYRGLNRGRTERDYPFSRSVSVCHKMIPSDKN
jgi:hypothetical protein